ncbi:hypothetical protein HDU76_013510 [Blyttiomyces sp. JEL0837]|nr:hypothetical protein HDU76_013510 [Blyttiomyces sp. JEL0837]
MTRKDVHISTNNNNNNPAKARDQSKWQPFSPYFGGPKSPFFPLGSPTTENPNAMKYTYLYTASILTSFYGFFRSRKLILLTSLIATVILFDIIFLHLLTPVVDDNVRSGSKIKGSTSGSTSGSSKQQSSTTSDSKKFKNVKDILTNPYRRLSMQEKLDFILDHPFYTVQDSLSIPEFIKSKKYSLKSNPEDPKAKKYNIAEITRSLYLDKRVFDPKTGDFGLPPVSLPDKPFTSVIKSVPEALPHNGYMLQHGPTVLRNTFRRDRDVHVIAFDDSLRLFFAELDDHLNDGLDEEMGMDYCPTMPECKFYFSNDYESMATEADALVTDKIDAGLIVPNAPLHFTKIGVLPNPGRPVEDYVWWGTDAAGIHSEISLLERHRSTPVPIPLFQIQPQIQELVKPFTQPKFDIKRPMILFVVPESICDSTDSRKQHVIDTLVNLATRNSLPMMFLIPDFGAGINETVSIGLGTYGQCNLLENVPRSKLDLMGKANKGLYETAKKNYYDFHQLESAISEVDERCRYAKPDVPEDLDDLGIAFLRIRDFYFQCVMDHALGTIIVEPFLSVDLISEWAWRAHASGSLIMSKFLKNDLHSEGDFIVDMDRDDLPPSTLRCLDWHRHSQQGKDPLRIYSDEFEKSYQPLRGGEISLIYKNIYAWLLILIHNQNSAIIVEDDSKLDPGVTVDAVVDSLKVLPPNYSAMMLGTCVNEATGGEDHERIVSAAFSSRCTGAYSISKQGVLLMFKNFPLRGPVDIQMIDWKEEDVWKLFRHPDYRNYWVTPAVIRPSTDLNSEAETNIRV